MSLSSSNPLGTSRPTDATHANATNARVVSAVHDRIVGIANRSPNRSEFLRSLAAELQHAFGAAIVAVGSSHWPRPMMLVVDELLSTRLQRDAIRELLRTAPESANTCVVPTIGDSHAGESRASGTEASNVDGGVQGFVTQIAAAPHVASVLVIQPSHGPHVPSGKVGQLQLLGQYARAASLVTRQLPAMEASTAPVSSNDGKGRSDAHTSLERKTNTERDDRASAKSPHPRRDFSRQDLSLFHLSLDLPETADRIANETRRLLGCDRVTLLTPVGKRYRVHAVSGVAVVDRRSNSVRATEQLCKAVTVIGKTGPLPGESSLAPQIEKPLDEYLDATDVTSVMVVPLYDLSRDGVDGLLLAADPPRRDGERPLGVLLLETFQSEPILEMSPAVGLIEREASLALRNTLEHHHLFGLRVWKLLGRLFHGIRRPWLLGLTFAAVFTLLLGCFLEIDHQVIATGTLQPSLQQDVFAAVDGTVQTIHVKDGQKVRQGDMLLTLENAKLDQQAEKLTGEILTAQKRLSSLRAVRLGGQLDQVRSSQMAMEQRQLESELANLVAQQEVVRQQQASLEIVSPIDGTVIAWQIRRRLANRPVTTGNLLVRIADHDSPWILDLAIPDQDGRDILTALDESQTLPISFASATAPEQTFAGSVEGIGTVSRLNERGLYVIDAIASIAMKGEHAFLPADHRVGADVTAKINCGPRTIVASWFGDVANFVHRHVLFYL